MTEFLFFTQPLALFLTALLPLLWLLFRLLPLRPKRVVFPALVLFGTDKKDRPKPRDIPWWLKLLRIAAALFFIMALAKPVYDPAHQALSFQPTLIVIDNSWSAAKGWPQRIEAVRSRLNAFADISQVPLAVLATAPDDETGQVLFKNNMTPQEALRFVTSLTPQPWASDYVQAREVIRNFLYRENHAWEIFWFGDGQGGADMRSFYNAVSDYGEVHLYHDDLLNTGLAITGAVPTEDGIDVSIRRRQPGTGNRIKLSLVANNGDILMQDEARFESESSELVHTLKAPIEVLNQAGRLMAGAETTAATTWHVNGGWSKGQSGIMTRLDTKRKQDYLSDVFYIARGMETSASLTTGTVDTLTSDESVSLIILPDSTVPDEQAYALLGRWVEAGGTLLRFAGPNLLKERDPQLLPVKIYGGERTLGGAMTWAEPARIGSYSPASPFTGLDIPKNMVVRQQVLARPSVDLNDKRWISLQDQTPLLTAMPKGQGRIILMHTSADTEWSDIVLSDFFPAMLDAVMQSTLNNVLPVSDGMMLFPYRSMDGFGYPQRPANIAGLVSYRALSTKGAAPERPPGLYKAAENGNEKSLLAFNLGESLGEQDFEKPDYYYFDDVLSYDVQPYFSMAIVFYLLALSCFLADLVMSFILMRGKDFYKMAGRGIAVGMLLLTFYPQTASAQNNDNVRDVLTGIENKIDFAYIETGNERRDQVSARGLDALGRIVRQRTTVEYNRTVGVDPETDELSVYPFLYWPMVPAQTPLNEQGIKNLQDYIDNGGLIFIDTRDGQYSEAGTKPGQETLQKMIAGLRVGNLEKLNQEHVLARSYYLLKSFEGLYSGHPVWVETSHGQNYDGAPAIVIGAHDWATAWSAMDAAADTISFQTSGRGQEMALRFGINLVMMSLTGNYKTDQVHIKYILERFGNE